MKTNRTVTVEDLKEDLIYNPDTGLFTRKVDKNKRFVAGQVAGCIHHTGYVLVGLKKYRYFAHRLAWLYMYGEFPSSQIDHINQDKTDNRISNLRLVTPSENMQNVSQNPRNTSGAKGVCWNASSRKWQSQIKANGKSIYLGLFSELESASAAYKAAAAKYHTVNSAVAA